VYPHRALSQCSLRRLAPARRLLLAFGLAASLSATADAQDFVVRQAGAVAPRVWLTLGEGLALMQGGGRYGPGVGHVPHLGGGFRFSAYNGIEATVQLTQAIVGNGDAIAEPRPIPPNFSAITASWVGLRGSPQLPFNQVAGLGVGAYRAGDTDKVYPGAQAFFESAVGVVWRTVLDGGVRIVVVPNLPRGTVMNLAFTMTARTR
jgi:hypothetical protein